MNELDNNFPTINRSKKNPLRFILPSLLLVIIVAFLIFNVPKLLGKKENVKQNDSVIPTPTEFVFPTESDSASQSLIDDSITPEITKTPTVSPTISSKDKVSGLDRSDLAVEVKNGNGEVGAGSKGSEVLKEFGYHVVSVANADNFNYENTIIKIKKEKSNYLSLLKKDLSLTYTIGSTSFDLSSSSSADAIVILGKE